MYKSEFISDPAISLAHLNRTIAILTQYQVYIPQAIDDDLDGCQEWRTQPDGFCSCDDCSEPCTDEAAINEAYDEWEREQDRLVDEAYEAHLDAQDPANFHPASQALQEPYGAEHIARYMNEDGFIRPEYTEYFETLGFDPDVEEAIAEYRTKFKGWTRDRIVAYKAYLTTCSTMVPTHEEDCDCGWADCGNCEY